MRPERRENRRIGKVLLVQADIAEAVHLVVLVNSGKVNGPVLTRLESKARSSAVPHR